ncbi:MAG TPA: carbohydrate-binding protein [Candidatus Paceibacterota bacterium]|nr:carbohydrate-binding protein [Verrucomicrobiota bacterium]HSA09108.1 carbohydrate-binding protein [Candidatus Paceibacterota bacterium]
MSVIPTTPQRSWAVECFPLPSSRRFRFPAAAILHLALLAACSTAWGSTGIHTTWLWHLHQPVYWPDRRNYGTDHYEAAWDTIQQQDAGRPHPNPEGLRTIFGLDDRVNAYQGRPSAALGTIGGYLNSGAQISYSGALMENVQSLGAARQLGYDPAWYGANRNARTWTTTAGKPRMDLVNFTYHHALAPLLSDATLEMELRIHRRQMEIFWGTNPAFSRGYFPTETCFSERMIPILKRVGIDWTIIANTHLARACADFPVAVGSGGENCDLPNLADQLNPAQGAGNYQRISIDRGCSPIQVMPFGFQLHYARHVDPDTGAESKIIVVPSDQALGWKDSYGQWGLGLLDPLDARNNPAKPALVMCAHDGDNAWSGGYSYYMEWVQNFASQASGRGYELTTVEQFLQEFPPDANDVVHVEDGGWVYADGDFGSPIFINWHWPPSYSSSGVNVVDPSQGVSDKADNWRVIIATENRVKTAQQVAGVTPNIDQVRDPGSFSTTPNGVELGWHYYLGSLDSGFVYYGCHDDECHRAVVAQSNAVRNVNGILAGNPAGDTTAPTLFPPQRHPWNPGGTNFGVQYGYKLTVATNSDFWVWTYGYDVSGISNVTLHFRINGTNPPTSDQFKTYAGGPLAGAWLTSNMTKRVVAPVIGVTPQYIADYYYAKVSGVTNSYVDYYVAGTDSRGNTCKSPIYHVYVGASQGGGGGGATNGCNDRVCVSPAPPVAGVSATIAFTPVGGPLVGASAIYIHLGWNGWSTVVNPDPAMTFNSASNRWEYTVTVPADATQLDCVFNNGSGTWDNNGGQDWHFPVSSTPQAPSQPQNLVLVPVQTNQINLAWSASSGATAYIVHRAGSPLALTTAVTYSDTGLAADNYYCYSVVASNNIGLSAPSATVCTNTLAAPPTNIPPFILDGTFNYPGYQLASSGMVLYGALRGTTLYVATWSTGTSGPNDHFILVSDQLLSSATAGAPWAKTGYVAAATSKPFLASESINTYVAWFNAPASSTAFKAATSSGAMAGTIDLVAAFGYMPTNIYLCAAAYQTADNGVLAAQCPAGTGPDIDPGEFFVIPTAALHDNNADGKFDRLDPALGFTLQNLQVGASGYAVNWAAMPGHSYQVEWTAFLGGAWSNLPGGLTTAGPLQLILSCTDPVPPAAATQRFYRVRLLP